MRCCLHCKTPVTAEAGFYELARRPSGDLYTLCSLPCLAAFVRGGGDVEQVALHDPAVRAAVAEAKAGDRSKLRSRAADNTGKSQRGSDQ